MLGISGVELVILLVFAFLLFGPDRLPAMGRTIGRALRQFRSAQERMNTMVRTEVVEPLNQVMAEPPKRQGPKKKITGANASAKPETFAEKKARLAAESQETAQRRLAVASGEEPEPFTVTSTYRPGVTSETFAQRKARLEAEKAAAAEKKESGSEKAAQSTTTTVKTTAKKSTSSAAKLYGIDKDRIAAARAAAAQRNSGKEEQAEA